MSDARPPLPVSPLSAPWRWLRLAARVAVLMGSGRDTPQLIQKSYDRLAAGYDEAWTSHMRDLSLAMLDRLAPPQGSRCIDLTCGTGFVAGELQRRTGGEVIGVDASAGMLDVARRNHVECRFEHGDVLEFLKHQPDVSADVITCAWGLGYSRPAKVIGEIARVLRPGGRVGIIDNSLFSLAGIIWASTLAFAQRPEALEHVMSVRFLPHSAILATFMRWHGLRVQWRTDGARSYHVPDGQSAIARLQATGAAAGFEFASRPQWRDELFSRFANVLDRRAGRRGQLAITHRYLAAIGAKPC